ncbi:MAG: 2-succinyl-5-enolpyruvyl-6-hydroxy-3-cyclohexene-1-carboxylic-acid synthase [Planctomycetales bacterium 4572_13]|nr:MAG: 2-succinyl-5-enolpyruvyl-6-hydroxy-3-cyclohexene-1-carboxylic-acid synthase [Planctomycetales bacterium 4572_13]
MENNLNDFWAGLIVEELIRCGVDHFCITPGSRSTPLVVAAARNAKAQCVICFDERVAGFYALGYAKAANKPAVVITTSGTAVANLLPAVTEAHTDKVPMFLMTADRPEECVDTGVNQTLRQTEIFAGFLRWCHSLPCPTEAFGPEAVLTTIDQAVFRTHSLGGGPVHLNCRYREPLESCEPCIDEKQTAKINNWIDSNVPFTSYQETQLCLNEKTLDNVLGAIKGAERGLIVIGGLKTNLEREKISALTEKLNWPVYADITSGIRLSVPATSGIRYFDQQCLSSEFNQAARPSVVLHLGGRTTSKRLDQFLDDCRPDPYIVIDSSPDRYDRVHAVTMRIQADSAQAAAMIAKKIDTGQESPYSGLMRKISTQTNAVIEQMIEDDTRLSEPFVARSLSRIIPEDSCLFLSNSMPVRDMDLYGVNNRKTIFSAANRGVSGIDGVLSTAIGLTTARETPTTLVIGDVAFMYDLNALALLSRQALPIIVVVINNQGGGIFDFLPISQSPDVLDKFFVARHDFQFAGVCETFKIDYYKACEKEDFIPAYAEAVKKRMPVVIEVMTDRKTNLELRRSIKNKMIEILEQSIQ